MGRGPNPAEANNAAEFVALMRQLRRWADLSYRQLERNATDVGDVLPRATISAALGRDDLPREELLAAYVRACGSDDDTVTAWLEARRRLSITDTMPPPPASRDTPQPDARADENEPQEHPSSPEPADDNQHAQEAGPDAAAKAGPAEEAEPRPAGDDSAPHARSAWRRHSPQVAIAACAVAGILALTFWPHDDDGTDRDRADSTPTPAELRPSASATSAEAETTEPAPSPSSELAAPPLDAPAEEEDPTPSTRPTPAPARMPAAGAARMHPASAPSRCLTEGRERNGRTDREIAVQHPCADSPLPRVELEKLSGDVYRIQWYNPDPGKGLGCLAVDDASTSPGALLAPRECADSASQKFRLEASGNGFRLRPLHSGLCIGFLPPATDGAEAVQTACTGTSAQVFTFTAG
ncbi:XRE family transcriptional regulator [Streptomyces sp. UH6]|uniref:XRE family transcriptional regulator n=1 Tax=Streptomyces sp. UH6 TaxID=2748379 RepID=UPI0015D52193|nr:XRE family transcriptional regulator [Streptomyces sp. UH6]NYV73498.1 RICIN domain-containing protein [Streptomyces sp. UH6]